MLKNMLACSICHEYAYHPVVLACYHMYCALCIEKHKMNSLQCPLCGVSFYNYALVRNAFLGEVIRYFREEYDYYYLPRCTGPESSSSDASKSIGEVFRVDTDYSPTEELSSAICNDSTSPDKLASFSKHVASAGYNPNQEQKLPSPKLPGKVQNRTELFEGTDDDYDGNLTLEQKKKAIKPTQHIEFSVSTSDTPEDKVKMLEFALQKPQSLNHYLKKQKTIKEESKQENPFYKLVSLEEVSITSDPVESDKSEHENDVFGKPAVKCKVCKTFIKLPNYQLHKSCCVPGKASTVGHAQMRLNTPKKKKTSKYVYSEDYSDVYVRDLLIVMGFMAKRLEGKTSYYLRNLLRTACQTYTELNNDAEFFKNYDAILQMACEDAVASKELYADLLLKLVECSEKSVKLTIRRILAKKWDTDGPVVVN